MRKEIRAINVVGFILFIFAFCTISYSAEFLSKEKHVIIDKTWTIRAIYRKALSIDSHEDVLTFSEIFLPVKNPIRNISGVYAYTWNKDGQRIAGQQDEHRIIFHDLAVGSTIEYGFTIETRFVGFEGLFSDQFKVNDVSKVGKAVYAVTFPSSTRFRWALDSNHDGLKKEIEEVHQKHFHWECSGLGCEPEAAILRITTLSSWDEVRNHLGKLYWGVLEGRKGNIELPEIGVVEDVSIKKKAEVVMDFLKGNFQYITYMDANHNLVPDNPATVLRRGWGDCKDVAFLGVIILKELGVDAFPVLTGPGNCLGMSRDFPDPYLLNHAVLGIQLEEGVRYYDYLNTDYNVDTEEKILIALRIENDGQ